MPEVELKVLNKGKEKFKCLIMDLKTEKLELVRLLLDTNNEKLLKKIKGMLTREKIDETDYLLSTEENRKRLEEGIEQANQGNTKSVDINDLWK